MKRNLSGARAAVAVRAAKSKSAPAAPPRRRKKPGPKPGPKAAFLRKRNRERAAQKEAFLPKFDLFLERLRANDSHRDALDAANLSWADVSTQLNTNDLSLRARYDAAKALREEFRKEERLDALHARGVKGVQEPMVSAGQRVCDRTVYSDACLLKAVVADNPGKFADRQKLDATLNTPETLADLVRQIEDATPPGTTAPVTPYPGLPLPEKPKPDSASDK
jgi:hypothetical protein